MSIIRKQKINWIDIKDAYVYAEPEITSDNGRIRFPTLSEIAERYDVHVYMVNNRASKEGWYNQRKAYQKKLADLHNMEINIMSLRKSAMMDGDNILRLEKFGKLIDSWLDQHVPSEQSEERSEECDVNYVEYDENEVLNEVKNEVSMKELALAIGSMEKLHKLNRDIMGEPLNYYEFYKEKIKEEKRQAEKGKAVSKSDIRELIASIRDEKSSAKVTLDVDVTECNEEYVSE